MAQFRYALLALGFALAATVPARADDAADARALVEKAVKAHGGQDKLDKFPGLTVKFKGTFHGMGDGIPMTGTVATLGADKQRIDIEVEAGGQKIPVVFVLDGDKAWAKLGKDVKEVGKDESAEMKEQAYAGWVATLTPLKDEQFKLATVGEIMVDKKPARGVKVSRKGHRDVDLYFDTETHLLVKIEARVKDEGSGQEVTQENIVGDHKEVQGIKQSMKFTAKRSGKLYSEGEITDVQLSEKLDAGTFAKPE